MDDGGGAMISWTVLSLLHSLNIRAKRTIRCVLWSCEEFGGIGADQYFDAHQSEIPSMSIVMESDMGVFHPLGLEFTGSNKSQEVNRRTKHLLIFTNLLLLLLDHQIHLFSLNINQCHSSRTRRWWYRYRSMGRTWCTGCFPSQ